MDFPDLPHLRKLQADLWSWPRSRSAVMVGAGMSLNAEALPGFASSFPTWRELVRAMFDELHPRSSDDTVEVRRARETRFKGTNPLRIASEYEAAFGRQKLDHLILEKNPDAFYRPGRLHKLLLQLPWVDVFTTNYDTLLERTEVHNRAYQPVIRAIELTSAFAPRIVKLHGSFPSQTPFIVTEEDYRTYPRKFSPFVNSVQQSLLENSFVLLGFSGDDPNFLEWSGWIRDELGNEHAPIYLVGALNLRQPDRALLSQRGITPIDIASLFVGREPAQGLQAAALEWFLSSLASAKTPRPEKWPNTPTVTIATPLGCPPLYTGNLEVPPKVDLAPTSGAPISLAIIQSTINRWQFERLRFPGWLVLEESKRSEMWLNTKYWVQPLIEVSKDWGAFERLLLFREINWRLEIAFVPLFSDILEHFLKAFEQGCSELLAGHRPANPRTSIETAREALIDVGFALLREARETYISERWMMLKEKLEHQMTLQPKFEDRYIYENVLWAMWNIQYEKAKESLAKWQPSREKPLAGMWKAGLLAELDELGESRSLLRAILSEIRGALRNQGNNIELLSLEGWCTYLLASVESAFDISKYQQIRDEFWERWQELKAWDCSPWPHKEYFDEALAKSPPTFKDGESITRGFDIGHASRTYNWRGDFVDDYLPAFGYIRLYEQAGIPMRLRGINLGSQPLTNACRWISPFIPFWSPALLVRAGLEKEFKEGDILSRFTVALMKVDLAERLHKWGLEILSEQLRKVQGSISMGSVQEGIIESLAEILSRICLRVGPEHLKATFPVAVEIFNNEGIRNHIRMHDLASPLFRRLFMAADSDVLMEWLPSLIRLPLFEQDGPSFIPAIHLCPDPMRYFPTERARRSAFSDTEHIKLIQEAIGWLLIRIKSEEGEARQRALSRLTTLYQARLMTEEQEVEFGDVIWQKRKKSGLAKVDNFTLFGLFHLPAPKDVDVSALVSRHLLSMSAKGIVSYDENGKMQVAGPGWTVLPFLLEVSLASKPLIQIRGEALGKLEWSVEDSKQLYQKIQAWWENDRKLLEGNHEVSMFSFGKAPVVDTLKELGGFLSRAVLPKAEWFDREEWDRLLDWINRLREFGIFVDDAFPYILLHRPAEAAKFEETIKGDLESEIADSVKASAVAVRHWLHLAEAGKVPAPSSVLLEGLIDRFIFRRKAGIEDVVSELTYLIVGMPLKFSDAEMRIIEKSLVSWHLATAISRDNDGTREFSEADCPTLRFDLARMAGAVELWYEKKGSGLSDRSGVLLWKRISSEEAFPEVRLAFDVFRKELSVD